jgi:hypothetical protein
VAKRKPALLLTLGTAIAFITGGGAAYWWLHWRQERRSPASIPVGMEVIPQTSLMTLSLSTDPQQWQTVRSFGTPESQAQVDQLLARWRDRWLDTHSLDFSRDLQPWIGPEMTLAILPPAEATDNTNGSLPPVPHETEHRMVAILPIADPLQAQRLLGDRIDHAEATETYQGVALQTLTPENGQTYGAAVFDNRFVAIASDLDQLKQLVDAGQRNRAMANLTSYQDAIRQTSAEQPFLRAYLNLPALQAQGADSPLPSWAALQYNQGLAATITPESQGLRVQTLIWRSTDQANPTISNEKTDIARLLPAETLLMISGSNLRNVWQQYDRQAADSPPSRPNAGPPSLLNPTTIRQGLQSSLGLDIDQDLMAWMTGEFALGVIPIPDPSVANGHSLGGVLVVKASDRSLAEQSLSAMDEVMQRRYRFQVSETTVGGEPVTTWVQPFSGLTIMRGWLPGDRAFLALRSAVADTLLPQPATPLTDTALYQTLTSNDDRTNGQFFLNLDALLAPDNTIPIPPVPDRYDPYLSSLQALSATIRAQTPQTTLYDIYVMLHRGRSPGPLPTVDPALDPPPFFELPAVDVPIAPDPSAPE